MPTVDVTPTRLRELVQPLGHTVCQTLGLGQAERLLRETDQNYLVITNMSYRALGIVTDSDLAYYKSFDPHGWESRRCAALVQDQPYLRLDDPIDDVIELFSHKQVRPLLVSGRRRAVAVLRPTETFQWCAEHRPSALEQLAPRVCL